MTCIYGALLNCSIATQATAQNVPGFDSGVGQWGYFEEKKYHEEQKAEAEKIVDKINPKSVDHHQYHDGNEIADIIKNLQYDDEVVLNDATYDECLQYEMVGLCLSINPTPEGPSVKLTPYVRYWGPWQRAEEVPEMFRSGYIPKIVVEPVKKEMLKTYYTEFMPDVAQKQMDYSMQVSSDFLNKRIGTSLDPKAIPTLDPDQKISKATQDAIEKYGENNMGEAAPYQDGYLFNEYHLMPLKSSIYQEMKRPYAAPFYGWCHTQKFPLLWASEAPGMNVYSRYSAQSQLHFPNEMAAMRSNPTNCIGYNYQTGFTSSKIAGLNLLEPVSLPCQAKNQGPWVPITNKVQTMYQTTAAAIGFTRSKIAFKRMPYSFYNITPDVDKVQWIRNTRMDGPEKPGGGAQKDPKTKKCAKVQKFVLEYEKGNLKINKGDDKDHWNVIAHWRKVRCCAVGGVPVLVFVAGETLIPIPEGEIDY
jgi:hypothetical protein